MSAVENGRGTSTTLDFLTVTVALETTPLLVAPSLAAGPASTCRPSPMANGNGSRNTSPKPEMPAIKRAHASRPVGCKDFECDKISGGGPAWISGGGPAWHAPRANAVDSRVTRLRYFCNIATGPQLTITVPNATYGTQILDACTMNAKAIAATYPKRGRRSYQTDLPTTPVPGFTLQTSNV